MSGVPVLFYYIRLFTLLPGTLRTSAAQQLRSLGDQAPSTGVHLQDTSHSLALLPPTSQEGQLSLSSGGLGRGLQLRRSGTRSWHPSGR